VDPDLVPKEQKKKNVKKFYVFEKCDVPRLNLELGSPSWRSTV
jgi:hypothetical protein